MGVEKEDGYFYSLLHDSILVYDCVGQCERGCVETVYVAPLCPQQQIMAINTQRPDLLQSVAHWIYDNNYNNHRLSRKLVAALFSLNNLTTAHINCTSYLIYYFVIQFILNVEFKENDYTFSMEYKFSILSYNFKTSYFNL